MSHVRLQHYLKWEDVANDADLNTFAKSNNLDHGILTSSKSDAIVIPNNTIFPEISVKYNLFSQKFKNVYKALKDGGLKIIIYDDEKEKRELILDSADIILPIILFLGGNAASLGLNILSNWIYDKWVKSEGSKKTSISVEYLEIGNAENIIRWRKIEGPADEIRKLLSEESQNLLINGKINKV